MNHDNERPDLGDIKAVNLYGTFDDVAVDNGIKVSGHYNIDAYHGGVVYEIWHATDAKGVEVCLGEVHGTLETINSRIVDAIYEADEHVAMTAVANIQMQMMFHAVFGPAGAEPLVDEYLLCGSIQA